MFVRLRLTRTLSFFARRRQILIEIRPPSDLAVASMQGDGHRGNDTAAGTSRGLIATSQGRRSTSVTIADARSRYPMPLRRSGDLRRLESEEASHQTFTPDAATSTQPTRHIAKEPEAIAAPSARRRTSHLSRRGSPAIAASREHRGRRDGAQRAAAPELRRRELATSPSCACPECRARSA